MLPEETYNGPAAPRSVRKIETQLQGQGHLGPRADGLRHRRRRRRAGRGAPGTAGAHQEPGGPEPGEAGVRRQRSSSMAEGRRPLPDLGGRAVPRAPPGHADHRGAQQVVQPQDGAGAARAGVERRAGRVPGRRAVSGGTAARRSGARCCSTSSTTSCPVRRSSGSTTRAWRGYAALLAEVGAHHRQTRRTPGRAGRHDAGWLRRWWCTTRCRGQRTEWVRAATIGGCRSRSRRWATPSVEAVARAAVGCRRCLLAATAALENDLLRVRFRGGRRVSSRSFDKRLGREVLARRARPPTGWPCTATRRRLGLPDGLRRAGAADDGAGRVGGRSRWPAGRRDADLPPRPLRAGRRRSA